MISFIVTTYNLEDWLLRRCLSSIVAQGLSRSQYEIIVVDDESTISPQHVVDEFALQASIALYKQRHARQGAARNLALRYAQGEWIQFVDGDDYLFANTIPHCLDLAQENRLDLLMFGFSKVYDREMIANATSSATMQPITAGDIYMQQHNLFGSCCMMLFRRQLLDDTMFGAPLRFTEGVYVEDEEFVTRLVWRAQRLSTLNLPVYAYYQRQGSTVHNQGLEHTNELFCNYFVVLKRLSDFEKTLSDTPHEGLTRKIRFLSVDILRRALREPDWKSRWEQSVLQLCELGLYPLPPANYSYKYGAFRLLSQCRLGRSVLRIIEKYSVL